MFLFVAFFGISRVERKRVIIAAIFLEGGLVVIAWFLGRLFKIPVFDSLDTTFEGLSLGLLGVLPLLSGLWFTLRSNWLPLRRLRYDLHKVVALLFKDTSLFELAVISALAGIGEETLFRGFLQPLIANLSSLWIALILTNIVFGALHLISAPYGIVAMGVGIYLGMLQIATNNLVVPVVTHAVYDFLGLVYLMRFAKTVDGSVSPGSPSDGLQDANV